MPLASIFFKDVSSLTVLEEALEEASVAAHGFFINFVGRAATIPLKEAFNDFDACASPRASARGITGDEAGADPADAIMTSKKSLTEGTTVACISQMLS